MSMIDKLVLGLIADTSKFTKPMKKAGNEVVAFGKKAYSGLNKVGSAIEGVAGHWAVLGGVGIAAGLTAGLGAMVSTSLESAKATDTLAKRVDASTEAISRLQYAAGTVGIEGEEFGDALSDMQEKLGDAFQGGGEAVEALQALGISLDSIKGKSADETFSILAEAISKTGDTADRLHLADQLFGGSGQKLLPLLNQGADGLKKLGAEADRLGVTLSSSGAANAAEASMALDKLWQIGVGLSQTLAVELAPVISTVATSFLDWITSIGSGESVVQSFVGGVGDTLSTVASFVDRLLGGFQLLQSQVSNFFGALSYALGLVFEPFENFVNLVTGLEISIGKTLKTIGKDLTELSVTQMQSGLGKIFDPSDMGVDAFFQSITDGSKQAVGALTGGLPGSAPNKISDLDAAKAEKEAAEKEAEAEEKRQKSEADSLTASLRTPAEILKDEISKIDTLFSKGLISSETRDRALVKASTDFESATRKEENVGFTAAADFRSAEGRSALLAASGINSGDLKKTAQEQLAEAKKLNGNIDKLIAAQAKEMYAIV